MITSISIHLPFVSPPILVQKKSIGVHWNALTKKNTKPTTAARRVTTYVAMRWNVMTPVMRRKKKPAEIFANVMEHAYARKQSHQHYWLISKDYRTNSKKKATYTHSMN
jgi:hypothetical protein